MWLLRFPGVYRPQADTHLLTEAACEARIPRGGRVLDVCTGTGAVAVTAARHGAEVNAVDTSRRAVLSASINAGLRRLPVRVWRANAFAGAAMGRFDLVLANPPYVPVAPGSGRARGSARAWDAGPDGRRFLDPLCAMARGLLSDNGTFLLVHSALCGTDRTLALLRGMDLKAFVVRRRVQPFGPVLRGRVRYLERAGLIEPGQRHEELVVIRADRVGSR